MTQSDITAEARRAFIVAAEAKGYTVTRVTVSLTTTWEFDDRMPNVVVEVERWKLAAEVHGVNQFGAQRYRQIREGGATTGQALACAIAMLDTPW